MTDDELLASAFRRLLDEGGARFSSSRAGELMVTGMYLLVTVEQEAAIRRELHGPEQERTPSEPVETTDGSSEYPVTLTNRADGICALNGCGQPLPEYPVTLTMGFEPVGTFSSGTTFQLCQGHPEVLGRLARHP